LPRIAQAERVELPELLEFIRPRHRAVLITTRGDGRPQSSPLSCGVDAAGRIVISTYPQRAKTANVRRDPKVSLCVLSDDWDGPYVHIDGHADVLDMPEALDGLVEYFRSISGEHPDWDDYRAAMERDQRVIARFEIERAGPNVSG
jgi:PPOX class probable F420-dependent enzyme